jgi:hypothetical protein
MTFTVAFGVIAMSEVQRRYSFVSALAEIVSHLSIWPFQLAIIP